MTLPQKEKTVTTAGWRFWAIVFVLLLAPCTWIGWLVSVERAPVSVKVLMGVVFAAVLSGFIAWAVNLTLQKRELRRRMTQRKSRRRK